MELGWQLEYKEVDLVNLWDHKLGIGIYLFMGFAWLGVRRVFDWEHLVVLKACLGW